MSISVRTPVCETPVEVEPMVLVFIPKCWLGHFEFVCVGNRIAGRKSRMAFVKVSAFFLKNYHNISN